MLMSKLQSLNSQCLQLQRLSPGWILRWFLVWLMVATPDVWAAAGNVWLEPATLNVFLNTTFGLKMLVDSGTKKVGTYQVKFTVVT